MGKSLTKDLINQSNSAESGSVSHTCTLEIIPRKDAVGIKRSSDARFHLQIPRHWKPPIPVNPHAAQLGEETIKWIATLGCADWQMRRLIDFQSSHYIGVPFPTTEYERALLISKYLSLWLLWDDVEVENGHGGWRLETEDVLRAQLPPRPSIYDVGWLSLMRHAAARMSPTWISHLIAAMTVWSSAAQHESRVSLRYLEQGVRPTFADSLLSRIVTIGMGATAYLVEYATGVELPAVFHDHPIAQRIKRLSGVIVGLGNEIFSFAKDYASGFVNIIAILAAETGITVVEAFAQIIALHNATLREFDELETRLPDLGPSWEHPIRKWAQQLRYCSVGFTVWESQAPRYNKVKLRIGDRILEPEFVYV